MTKKVHFMIHDLNTWGGQDRSTLEVVNQLSPAQEVELHCYSIHGLNRKNTLERLVKPLIRRPVFLKAVYYQLRTFLMARTILSQGEDIISTGTCSMVANRFQIQFIHHAWDEVMNRYPELRQKSAWYQALYHRFWLSFNLFLEKAVYRKDRRYLALSHRVKSDLMRFFGIPESNIVVIPHGIDSKMFTPKQKDSGRKVILFVGEYRRKGLDNAILAFARVAPEIRKDWVLHAVGMGDEQHFRELIRSQGLESQVILEGHHKDILPFYQQADLFLLPTHYEPFGLVTIEAFACGLPSIVSCSSGAYELAKEGESVIGIRNPADVDEITAHLSHLMSDPEIRMQMGRAARAVAVNRNWLQVAREYEQWLQT